MPSTGLRRARRGIARSSSGIHGGGLQKGAASEAVYDAAVLAREHGVVVVTINYRLGVLGGSVDLSALGGTRLAESVNLGLRDQALALHWVRENIEAFGGNPDCVTAAGDSAGALGVVMLMANGETAGLIHQGTQSQSVLPESRCELPGDRASFKLPSKQCPFSGANMSEAVLDIKQWGNNLGVRLPAAVARAAHLHVDQRVRVSVEGGQVVIRPITGAHLTLEERVARFDPARHGGEAMTADRVLGAERW